MSSKVAGERSHLRPERLWLVLGIAWIVAVTLAPFEMSILPNELPGRFTEAFRAGDSLEPAKFAAHFFSFCALGLLLGATMATGWRLVPVVAIGLVGCLILEAAQLFESGRHARFLDLVLNVAALTLGRWVSERTTVGRACADWLRGRGPGVPIAFATIAVLATVVWFVIGLQPILGSLRMNWDPTFPLMIGNEWGGARPWLGQLGYAAVYDRALTAAEVKDASTSWQKWGGVQARASRGLLVGYDFRTNVVSELSPVGNLSTPDLDLLMPAEAAVSLATGLTTAKGLSIKSRGPARALTDAIVRSGALSVEVALKPENLSQAGPARVISNSFGPAVRNFTLGQSGADLVFRVRNNVNSSNGNVHELAAPGVLHTGAQHVVATYDHGVSSIFIDGESRSTKDLREPIYHSGLATGPVAKGALVCLAVITISLPALFVFDRFFSSAAARVAAFLSTWVVGILPYLISCGGLGGPWRFTFIASFLLAVVILFPPGVALVSGRQQFSR